jgi:tetratricopeptide (TPR) repeat protein
MKRILPIFLISFFSVSLTAQYVSNPFAIKNDSIECLQNISIYKEFQKQDLFDEAIPAWVKTYQSCKGFKKLIYQDGVKFLVRDIQKEKDNTKKKALVDSLMHVYAERIQYFGEEGFVKGRQGIDLFKYDKDRLEEAHKLLQESFELEKLETDASVTAYYMLSTDMLFRDEKIEKNQVVETYLKCIDQLEKQISKEKKPNYLKNYKTTLKVVEDIFAKSKAADCQSLVSAFASTFDEKSTDLEHLLKVQALLKGANCISDEFYFKVSEQIQKLQPTSENASILAGLLLKKEKYNESISYLKQAIELEKTDSLKASYYHDMGFINCHKLNKYSQARIDATEALKCRPNWGKPYLLIGDAYALSSAGFSNSDFEKATVFWSAVDKYYKAKQIDSTVEELANQKINFYSKYFPSGEEVFMQGYKDGASYNVGGWINENTTVRFRK